MRCGQTCRAAHKYQVVYIDTLRGSTARAVTAVITLHSGFYSAEVSSAAVSSAFSSSGVTNCV